MSRDINTTERKSKRTASNDSGRGRSRPPTPLVASGSHGDYDALLDSGEEEKKGVKFVQNTIFGEVRNVRRLTLIEWIFLILAAFSMVGVVAISIERFCNVHKKFQNLTADVKKQQSEDAFFFVLLDPSSEVNGNWNNLSNSTKYDSCESWTCTSDFIFAVALLVNVAFCVFYCCNGVLRERRFEILGYAVGILVILLYIVINYFIEGEQDDEMKLVRLVLACVVLPQNIILALVVQHKMGFLILNTIGSNQSLIRAFNLRSLFITVQKFNLQILANILVISWVKDGHFTVLGEKVMIFLILMYMVVVSYAGWTAVVWELHVLAIVWQVLLMPSPGFYIYKIANVAAHWGPYRESFLEYYTNGEPGDVTHYVYSAVTLLVVNLLGLLCCVCMSAFMIGAQSNFGKGLKDRLAPPCWRTMKCDIRQLSP